MCLYCKFSRSADLPRDSSEDEQQTGVGPESRVGRVECPEPRYLQVCVIRSGDDEVGGRLLSADARRGRRHDTAAGVRRRRHARQLLDTGEDVATRHRAVAGRERNSDPLSTHASK